MFFKRKNSNSSETLTNIKEKGKEKEEESIIEIEDKNVGNEKEKDNENDNDNENDKRDLSLFLDKSFLSTEKFPFSLRLFSEQTQTIQDYLPLQFLLPSSDFFWSSQNSYRYLLPERIASKVSNVSHASIFVLNTISQLIVTASSLAKSGASASMGVSRNALIRAFSTAENMQKAKSSSTPKYLLINCFFIHFIFYYKYIKFFILNIFNLKAIRKMKISKKQLVIIQILV